jgi:hypothetical protein
MGCTPLFVPTGSGEAEGGACGVKAGLLPAATDCGVCIMADTFILQVT